MSSALEASKTIGESHIKIFPKWTQPELPLKRFLTIEESNLMKKLFSKTYSWSKSVDRNGRIILGNGEDDGGIFYITEKDLLILKTYKNV